MVGLFPASFPPKGFSFTNLENRNNGAIMRTLGQRTGSLTALITGQVKKTPI
jgi:hypothetical protein